MLPLMMLPPSSESYMKMLEELYASVCGQDQCSSFILGKRWDRVVHIDRSAVAICSSCEPNKLVTLTPKRWANFIYCCEQIDNEAKELNFKSHPVAFRVHIDDGWYGSVTDGYNCMDFQRFYIPYGATREHVRPTRDECAELLVLVPTIHDRHPELAEARLQLHG